jgi:hypothetical protein
MLSGANVAVFRRLFGRQLKAESDAARVDVLDKPAKTQLEVGFLGVDRLGILVN